MVDLGVRFCSSSSILPGWIPHGIGLVRCVPTLCTLHEEGQLLSENETRERCVHVKGTDSKECFLLLCFRGLPSVL
jgi:hypothetical protein